MNYNIPEDLHRAFESNNLIPVVGAGVSMSLTDKSGKKIFPSWGELLGLAADELEHAGKENLAIAIRALLNLGEFQQAAKYARQGLTGTLWSQFFRKYFEEPLTRVSEDSKILPRTIWRLGNRLLTLNYDKVLRVTCPDFQRLIELDNSNRAELADFKRGTLQVPVIWHFHGRIDNIATLIFTTESYSDLYGGLDNNFQAALEVLRGLCRDNRLLLVGCSLEDADFLQELDKQHRLFASNTGPHYALVPKLQHDAIKQKIHGLPIELLVFEGFGDPLVNCINAIANGVPQQESTTKGMVGRQGRTPQTTQARKSSKKIAMLSASPLEEALNSAPTITWDVEEKGSPFPGLAHFTREFAPVFFGREGEVIEVLDRLHGPEGRFIIVSGNSGSGKSSLVDAGVLPKLEGNGLPGGRKCLSVRMAPSQGAHPFDALIRKLASWVEKAGLDPYWLAYELLSEPDKFTEVIRTIVSRADCDELVLFLDQMEELFTSRGKDQEKEGADAFLSALYQAVHETPLRVIATVRADFLHHCHQHPDMLKVLKGQGHYPLGPLMPYALDDAIRKPASCAGMTISASLVSRLIQEAGNDPGNLPLLAFVLDRLFIKREVNVLSEAAYDAFNGFRGALEEHIRDVEQELGAKALEQLPSLFQTLFVVNMEGQPTRRRVVKIRLPPDLRLIADHLASYRCRLLTAEGEGEESTVTIAHEKLFEAWPALARWIVENRDDLLIVRQAELEAREWQKHNHALTYLWDADRLQRLQGIITRLEHFDISPLARQYASPGAILIQMINREELSHGERLKIGQYLAELGDPRRGVGLTPEGLPDIDWVEIPAGTVTLEGVTGQFEVAPFQIARYPVTTCQFQSFVDAEDGYRNPEWWKGIRRIDLPGPPRDGANFPQRYVCWFEALGFCRWLTQKYHEGRLLKTEKIIRIPYEWEWQQAATGGKSNNKYPWGSDWNASYCNCNESRLNRTTAVGMYPCGTWPDGPFDMSGNVWEWCLNTYENPAATGATQIYMTDRQHGAMRGGSWYDVPSFVSPSFRSWSSSLFRDKGIGFRLATDI